MDFGLEGKTVLVTAGSAGIGLACAKGFSGEGAKVLICGRNGARLADAKSAANAADAYQCDVSDGAQIDTMMAAIAADHGGVDVLVNNAGGPPPGPFDALSDDAFLQAVELTLLSCVRVTRHVLPHMRAQRWGRVIVVSSFGVKQPVPGLTLSNTVRMGVLGWAKTLANQVGADNITVNTLCPGWTKTDRVSAVLDQASQTHGTSFEEELAKVTAAVPLGRAGDPAELANMAVFLGSDAASYVTGAAIAVDGGITAGY